MDLGALVNVRPGVRVTLPLLTQNFTKVGGLQVILKSESDPQGQPLPVLESVTTTPTQDGVPTSVDVNSATGEFMLCWVTGGSFPEGQAMGLNLRIPETAAPGTHYLMSLAPKFVVGPDYRNIPYTSSAGDILIAPQGLPTGQAPTAPTVRITSPGAGGSATGVIQVTGTAADDDPHNNGLYFYLLEYGKGESPSAYWKVALGTEVVKDGLLGLWDTTSLASGPYRLRLTAMNQAGFLKTVSEAVTLGSLAIGDVDGSGSVTVKDVVGILKMVIGLIVPTDAQRLAADVDGNGVLGVMDAVRLLKRIAGLIP
jgi:hypothetical protein